MTVAGAFDRLAPQYDALWDHSVTGRLQREAVWNAIRELFRPGDRVLDLGCGTGTDALRLAASGVRVHARDISPAMVDTAARRARLAGYSETIRCECRDAASPAAEAGYDGAISNFGVVNCIADLDGFADTVAPSIRRGGYVALCAIGKFCAWETLWYLFHVRPRAALRRLRASVRASMGFPVYYHSPHVIRAAFSRNFALVRQCGVGLIVPPSCAEAAARRARGLFRAAARIDAAIAGWPVARSLADHRLFVFRRLG